MSAGSVVSRSLRNIYQNRVVGWLAAIYLVYLTLCVLIVMPLINWGLNAVYQQQTGRTLHYNFIRFNPFALSLTLPNVRDNNSDGTNLWSAKQIYIDVAVVKSLINLAPAIDEIELDGINIHAHKLADGGWTFDDIQQHQAALAAAAPPETTDTTTDELPALLIKHIHIAIDSLKFSDDSQAEPFELDLQKIQFGLQDFSTLLEEGQPYRLQATLGEQGELNWIGDVSLKAAQSQGKLEISNINLQPAWQYFKSQLNFTLQKSLLNIQGQYQVNWKKDLYWSINQTELSLLENKVTSGKSNARDADINLGELRVTGINIASDTQLAAIDNVQVNGFSFASWSEGSESGLMRAFSIKNANSSTNVSSTGGDENNASKPWLAHIKTIAINDAAIDWRVAELEQHQFAIRKLNLTASNIDSSGKSPLDIQLNANIDQQTKFALGGDFNLISLDGNLTSTIEALPLALAQPMLTPYLLATIASGSLTTSAELQVRNAKLIQLKSKGEIADIKLIPNAANQELLVWKNLRWSDAQVNLTEQIIDLTLVELSGFDSRFIITTDGKTNFQTLFPETVASADEAKNTPASQQTTAKSNPADASAPAEKPWHFNLHKFVLDNASFRFNDESLTPQFTAAVQNFSGTMTDLSSDTSKPAAFKFRGDVDGYAPVTLQGKTQPFLEQPLLDARLDFENLDLGGFSSYSGTYAGWKIDRGLLTANLHYRLKDGRILGDNHIEMDQLLLGERVQSMNAMDIPLRLALALLTDENGLTTLDIGVSGDPADPSFNIGKVIRQAIRNTLVKIVSAPFKLLANLVGSKEDLGELPFNSGSSQLLTTATRRLNSLQEAMQKRPDLRIEVRGIYDQRSDLRGLQAAQVKHVLLNQGLENSDIKAQNERWQKAVTDEYRKLNLPKEGELTPVQMYKQWLQTIVIAPEALTELAAQRSINTKQFLVQQLNVDASRVLINSNLDCSETNLCTRRRVLLDLSDINQTAAQSTQPEEPAPAQ